MNALPRLLPVLLAGGSGTRLWPQSRELYPKQFLKLIDERSLLQNTALRAAALPGALPPAVICNQEHRFLVAEQLRQAGVQTPSVILEPEGRNSAPAAAVAAHFASERFGAETLVFLMAADHVIEDQEAFAEAVNLAVKQAQAGYIVAFGIVPTRAETGFGYVQAGEALPEGGRRVARFVEKPTQDKAERFLAEGAYLWNSGMFLFRADRFLAELQTFEPEMSEHAARALREASLDLDFIRLAPEAFAGCRADSIDYAVMEKTRCAAVVPLDAGWDDVGSWKYLARLPADERGNHVHGDVLLEDADNNLVHAGSRLVAVVGLKNHVVVETADAVLVTTQDAAQDVKKIVQRLKALGRSEATHHARVYRPWGWYETLALGPRFQVKRIQVLPGKKLSLQMHHHRAEHWVVVCGTGRVVCDEKEYLLSEDQSTYISLGHRHRLENPGKIPLEVIEVQTGAYLGEDDIVRFADVYGRNLQDGQTSEK